MGGNRPDRSVRSPGVGVFIVVAVGGCLAWLAWLEVRDQGWIPGVAPQPVSVAEQTVRDEPVDLPSAADVPQLVAILAEGYEDDRRQALLTLSSIGPPADVARDAIRDQLQDESPRIRYAAVVALERTCQDREALVGLIAGMLEDENSSVIDAAARTLETLGRPAIEAGEKALRGDSRGRARVVLMLRRLMRPDSFAEIGKIIRGLRDDPDPAVRAEALMFDLETGRMDSATIRGLLSADYTAAAVHPQPAPDPRGLGNDRNTSNMALRVVRRMGPTGGEFTPELIALFEKQAERDPVFSYEQTRQQARQFTAQIGQAPRLRLVLDAFGALKTGAREAIPHLTARLYQTDPRNRVAVIAVLRDIGAEPDALAPALTGLLAESEFWPAPRAAAALLAEVNPAEARRQVPLFIAKLDDPNVATLAPTVSILRGLGSEARESLPHLIRLLTDDGGRYSYAAVAALGALGPDAAPAVPAMISALEQVRQEGKIVSYGDRLETLGKIGPAAQDALPLLLELMDDSRLAPKSENGLSFAKLRFREQVMSALVGSGPDAPAVVTAIRSQLKNDLPQLRGAALFELGRLSHESPGVLDDIIAVLGNDPEPSVRTTAAAVIAGMSGDRSAALEPLINALDDLHPEARGAAATALGSMGSAAEAAVPRLRELWIDAFCGLSERPPSIESPALPTILNQMRVRDVVSFRDPSMAEILLRALMDIDPRSPVIE
jgi:HEAT repeat protein